MNVCTIPSEPSIYYDYAIQDILINTVNGLDALAQNYFILCLGSSFRLAYRLVLKWYAF